jgi:hypothetical protein
VLVFEAASTKTFITGRGHFNTSPGKFRKVELITFLAAVMIGTFSHQRFSQLKNKQVLETTVDHPMSTDFKGDHVIRAIS